MKHRPPLSFIVCFTLLFQPLTNAFSQLSIGITAGPASRWSVPKSIDALGLGFNASVKYRLWKGLVAGANFSYYKFNPEDKGSNYKTSYYSYTGSVEYHLLKNKLKPYAGLDLGVFNYHTVTTIDIVFSKLDFVKDEYYFGMAPVIGANYSLSKRFDLNANLKFNFVFIPEAAPIGYAYLSVGVFYKILP